MLRMRSLGSVAGVTIVLSALAGPSPASAAADAPPLLSAGFKAPKALPTALAKRHQHRKMRRGHRLARAASIAQYQLNPVRCDGGNTWMSITQPYMWGYASDANWVSVQHAVYKNEGTGWVFKAWGAAGFARAGLTRTSPATAWMLQNGTRLPWTVYQDVLWGFGDYRIAHYLTWYDAANRAVKTAFVWAQHISYGAEDWACEGMLPA